MIPSILLALPNVNIVRHDTTEVIKKGLGYIQTLLSVGGDDPGTLDRTTSGVTSRKNVKVR
jgi:hypothetical protein